MDNEDRENLVKSAKNEVVKSPPKKQFYTIKLEAMAPIEMEFRIFAESPQAAIEIFDKSLPPLVRPARPILSRMKKVKATVYKYGTNIYYFFKNYR